MKRSMAAIAVLLAFLSMLTACDTQRTPEPVGKPLVSPSGSPTVRPSDSNDPADHDEEVTPPAAVSEGPFANAPYPSEWRAVSVGTAHSAAIGNDDSLWIWGSHRHSDLPEGVSDDRTKPAKLMNDVKSVAASENITLVIMNDGTLWGWGDPSYDRLTLEYTPGVNNIGEALKIMDDVDSVTVSHYHVLAVKTDGSLWAWGRNESGQLGNGTLEDAAAPIKIMEDVKAAAAANFHSAAIKTDGTLWTWGSNHSGQLGDGTKTDRPEPIKVMEDVTRVAAANSEYTLAVKTDGSLWAWGRDDFGTIGVGSGGGMGNLKVEPVKVMDHVDTIQATGSHVMAIKTDGTLWAWGHGGAGRLGSGTEENQSSPIKIMDNVVAVSAGINHTVAAQADGSLWAWGDESSGKLGNGLDDRRTFHRQPIRIAN